MLHICVPRSPAGTHLSMFQYQLQVCPCFCPSALFFILLIPVLAASTLPDFTCPLMVRYVLYGIYFFMLLSSFISSSMKVHLLYVSGRCCHRPSYDLLLCFYARKSSSASTASNSSFALALEPRGSPSLNFCTFPSPAAMPLLPLLL